MRSFGDRLRKEREARGIELDSVSESTKINPKILRALESNRLGDLPGRVYNRGFVRAYAEYLGVDPDPLLDAYEEEERRRAPVTPVLPPPEPRGGLRAASPKRGRRLTRLFLVVAATLSSVAGLTVALWPPNDAAPEAGGIDLTATRKRIAAGAGRDAAGREPDRTPGESAAPTTEALPPEPAQEVPAEEAVTDQDGGDEPAAAGPLAPKPPASGVETAAPPASKPSSSGGQTAGPPAPEPQASGAGAAGAYTSKPPASVGGATAPPAPRRGGAGAVSGAGSLAIAESDLGATVVDHGLVERGRTFHVGDRVWFWTRVTGGSPGQVVRHHWLREGTLVASVDITLGGPNWRAYTRQTMGSDAVGSWTVELHDAEGRVLAREGFTCTRASREPQR